MKAIVTGGAGFIGSHVCDALLARGDEVHVIDNLTTGKRENVPSGAVLWPLSDINAPGLVFDAVEPDVVFHLAAMADVRKSVAEPRMDAHTNVLGTVSILEAALRHDAKVVFASTGGAIYGDCDQPATEQDACKPLSPYGAAKLASEGYLSMWNRLHGTEHVSLRLGNVYGPRQDPYGEAGVVAIFLGCMRDFRPATIYGEGSQERDYIYVADVVEAFLMAAEQPRYLPGPTVPGRVYNIGTGIPTSVSDLYARIWALDRNSDEPVFEEPRMGELQRCILDPYLASWELGWESKRSLQYGLSATWEWILRSPDYDRAVNL